MLFIACWCPIFLSNCGLSPVEAGFGGAAIGAGTGALIANAMADGDIAASAGIGGLIGFPAGIVLALVVDSMAGSSSKAADKDFSGEIASNQEQIYRNNLELDELRREVDDNAPSGNPAGSLREHRFDGATLGNPYR